jgi:hypothetical protein
MFDLTPAKNLKGLELLDYHNDNSGNPEYRQAFDQDVEYRCFLLGFFSVRESTIKEVPDTEAALRGVAAKDGIDPLRVVMALSAPIKSTVHVVVDAEFGADRAYTKREDADKYVADEIQEGGDPDQYVINEVEIHY